ncbi:MAG: NAD(P)/FAD-dependent oxidoreductase [Tagaea sp.]
MSRFDVAVLGAGILGASAAWRLAQAGARVALLEMEARPGYHTTGRSAALYETAYGPDPIRRLTLAAGEFLTAPPAGFAAAPVLAPRGTMFVATRARSADVDRALAEALPGTVREIERAEARVHCPALNPEWLDRALLNEDAQDIDVAALHQGYLRGFKAAGGTLVCDAEATGLARSGGVWRIATRAGAFEATTLVNAGGAWADAIAALAGVPGVGLVPKRRTAFVFETEFDARTWPFVCEIVEDFYFKPEAGLIFASPADETPSPPCDAQPEDIDVAECAAAIETATALRVGRIKRKWAGLRCFVADRCPVVGRDPAEKSFVWLAAPGGYGIMTSPALGELCASLALDRPAPPALARHGVDPSRLSPARLRAAA